MKQHTLDSKQIVLNTVDKLTALLKPTYGVGGRGVIIDDGITAGVIDDGYTIIEELELEDPYENAVLKIIKDTTRKTNERAGDGTTTSILLVSALLNAFFKADQSSFVLDGELKAALTDAVAAIRAKSQPISTKEEVQGIALNSYHNEAVAPLVAEAVMAVGADGRVILEESETFDSFIETKEGFSFDRGLVSPYMVTREGEAFVTDPYVIVTDQIVSSLQEIFPALEEAFKEKRPMFIICDGLEGDALPGLVLNKIQGKLTTVAVKIPTLGKRRADFLEDIGVLVGAKVFAAAKGEMLKSITKDDLGSAASVLADHNSTTIYGGKGDPDRIAQKITELEALLANTTDDFEKDMIRNRIAMFKNGVTVFKVGGYTESERKFTKAKVDDAIHAAQLALKEGVIPGVANVLAEIDDPRFKGALGAPFRVLLDNGVDTSEQITDPTGVAIAALESAVSIASTLIKSSGLITPKANEKA